MGLDISLVKFNSPPKFDPVENSYEYEGHIDLNIPSKVDTEETITYFRSSYNDSGFNRIISTLTGVYGFDFIFGNDSSMYVFKPDWSASKDRANQLLTELDIKSKLNGGLFNAMFVNGVDRQTIVSLKTNEIAIQKFLEQKKQNGTSNYNYSSREGTFFMGKPLEIVAALHGHQYGTDGVYLVYKMNDETISYLNRVILRTIETCDYVLEQPDADLHFMLWSG